MKFGKSTAQRAAERQARVYKETIGVKRFAFLPVKLHDGRYVWLQTYWRYLQAHLIGERPNRTLYVSDYDWDYECSAVEDKSLICWASSTYAKERKLT